MSQENTGASAPVADTSSAPIESSESQDNEILAGSESEVAPAAPLTKAEIKYLNKLKLKVDGQDYEESLPFELPDDPEVLAYMTKQLQMSKMAQKRAKSYSDLENNVNGFIEELQKNPRKVLSDPRFGIDLKKIAVEMIEEEINNSKKSPEQLKAEQLESELKELKESRDKEKKTSEEREFERLQQQESERYDVSMSRALEKSDLPKSPYVVKKMADYMLLGLQAGKDLSPEDVLPLVREEILEDIKSMFAVMPADVVEGIIGKDTIGKIRKKQVENAKKAAAQGPRSGVTETGKTTSKSADGKPKQSFKSFFGV